MKSVDEYFQPAAASTLYHYTGVGALVKIVESRKLFASHAYFLNDAREIKHASSVLQSAIVSFQGAASAQEREFLKQFAFWLKTMSDTSYGVFVFSLSAEMNLLSQWRSYTPHGRGVSIGFSAQFINGILSTGDFRLAQCIYDGHAQQQLALALVEKMFISFRSVELDLSGKPQGQEYYDFLESHRGTLLQVLAVMKHHAFSEENEWRLISKYYPNFTAGHLRFREGSSMLMPYVEIAFPDVPDKPFDKVVLGPSADPNLSMDALRFFLSCHKVSRVTLNSSIPYRRWG